MNASHICLTKSLQFAVCFTSDEFAALPLHVIFPLSFGHLALFSSDLAARSAITAFRLLLLLQGKESNEHSDELCSADG